MLQLGILGICSSRKFWKIAITRYGNWKPKYKWIVKRLKSERNLNELYMVGTRWSYVNQLEVVLINKQNYIHCTVLLDCKAMYHYEKRGI